MLIMSLAAVFIGCGYSENPKVSSTRSADIKGQNRNNLALTTNVQAATVKSKRVMNFKQIKKGNYTSLLGKWKLVAFADNRYDMNGIRWRKLDRKNPNLTLKITKKKIRLGKNGYAIFYGKRMKVKGENLKRKLKFNTRKNSLLAFSDSAILWSIEFCPKELHIPLTKKNKKYQPTAINSKKDTIEIFTSNMGDTEIFQRN